MMQSRCMPCHAENGHAPFRLDRYTDFKKRLELVRTVCLSKTMPPYRQSSDYELAGPHPFSDRELVVLQEWILSGAPEGSRLQPFSLSVPQRPDVEVSIGGKIQIRAEGAPYWMLITVPSSHFRGKQLTGFAINPEAKKAVRQVVMSQCMTVPKEFETAGRAPGDWIGSWTSQNGSWHLPTGFAVPIKKASSLVLQVLVVPTGKTESAVIRLGLFFARGRTTPLNLVVMRNLAFDIPPWKDTTLVQTYVLEQDALLLAVHPEARKYATDVSISAEEPGVSKPRSLLSIGAWQPIWCGNYTFSAPVKLRKGTKITASIYYSNDRHSVDDPNKFPELVRSGPGKADEMFGFCLQMAVSSKKGIQ